MHMHIHLNVPDLRVSFTSPVSETTQEIIQISPHIVVFPRVAILFVSQSSVIGAYSELSIVHDNGQQRQHR